MTHWLYVPIAWIVGGLFLIIVGIQEANKFYGGKKYTLKQFLRFVRKWN